MADNWRRDSTRQAKAALIDTTVPSAARAGDYLHGGRNSFEADRRAIMRALAAAVTAGSHIELYHQASDLDPAMPSATERWNAMSGQPITLRSRAQLAALLEGLNLVPPGLVPVTEWHPAPDDPRFEHAVPVYGVVARKP